MSARRVSAERLGRLATDLSARDLAVVRLVDQVRLATGSQILRAVWPNASESDARTARRALVRFVRERVLARLDRRVGGLGRGSDAWSYALDVAGQRLRHPGSARRPVLPSRPMWHHALTATEVHVRLVEATRGTDRNLAVWQGEPASWRAFTGPSGERVLLKPDAFIRLDGPGYSDSYWLEVDNGSQSRPVIRAKLDAYRRYAVTGLEQAASAVFPQAIFVTEHPARVATLVDVAGELPPELWPLVRIASLDDCARLLLHQPED